MSCIERVVGETLNVSALQRHKHPVLTSTLEVISSTPQFKLEKTENYSGKGLTKIHLCGAS